MLALLPLQQSKEIWVAKNVPIFFENGNLRNFLVPPLLILNKKRIVLILAMYKNTAPEPQGSCLATGASHIAIVKLTNWEKSSGSTYPYVQGAPLSPTILLK